jgi:uncharacterized coiled-coil DUF342 family protein
MTETNFMDELFQRINDLESENKILEETIRATQNELDNKALTNSLNIKEDTQIIQEIELLNQNEANNSIVKVNSNLKEITLEFVPFDNFKEVYIAGDFTNWNKLLTAKVFVYLNLGKWQI